MAEISEVPAVVITPKSYFSFFKKPKFLIIVILIVIILLPILFYLYRDSYLTSKFFHTDPLIASVNKEGIYLSDIKKESGEKASKKTLQLTLDRLIEQKILDIKAKELGVNVTNQQLWERFTQIKTGSQAASLSPFFRNLFKYQLIKERLTASQISSREAESISFWVPPFNWPEKLTEDQKKLAQAQRDEGTKALDEIEKRLKIGENPLELAKSIYNKYSTLRPILAVNASILEKTQDQSLMSKPRVYTADEYFKGQPFYDTLFTMNENDVKKVNLKDGSGGFVIKVTSIHSGNYKNYEQWLTDQKKKLVITYQTL